MWQLLSPSYAEENIVVHFVPFRGRKCGSRSCWQRNGLFETGMQVWFTAWLLVGAKCCQWVLKTKLPSVHNAHPCTHSQTHACRPPFQYHLTYSHTPKLELVLDNKVDRILVIITQIWNLALDNIRIPKVKCYFIVPFNLETHCR
jgi:hypothetical protein